MRAKKKKLPWRTLVPDVPTGRFTAEQIGKAIDEVMAERKAEEEAARKRRPTRKQ